jgi:hypothetical protein
MKRVITSFGLAVIVSGVAVATALAGGSTSVNGYGGVAGTIQASVKKGGGTLPFTGLDLGLIAGVAAAVVVVGVTMRRLSHSRS